MRVRRAWLTVVLGLGLPVTLAGQACREPVPCRATWTTGDHRTYRVNVRHAVHVDAPGGMLAVPLEGALEFTARIHLHAVTPTQLEVWTSDVERAQWTALGTTIPDAAQRVAGWRARIELGVDGDATQVTVGAHMDHADGTMFRALLLPAVAGGERVETTLGTVTAVAHQDAAADGASCRRTARSGNLPEPTFVPANLHNPSSTRAQFEATRTFSRGTLQSHSVDQAVEVSHNSRVVGRGSHTQTWTAVEDHGPVPAPVETVRVEVLPSRAHQRALELRAQGMTAFTLVADVVAYQQSGRVPDHSRWLWRATGVLEAETTAPARLAATCTTGALATPGMALALDILAGAGTPAAQDAMVAVMTHPLVRARQDHGALLQRAILVEHPVRTLVAVMAAEADSAARPEVRRYATSTLGALLWRAQEDVAREHAPVLLRRLAAARDDEADASAALMGMGNARRTEYAPAVVARTRHASTGIRAAAAAALGTTPGDDVTRALLTMVAEEKDPGVRAAVFGAVATRAWAGAPADDLVTAVQRGGVLGDPELEALLSVKMDTPARQRALWTAAQQRAHAGKDATHRLNEAISRLPPSG